MILFPSIRSKAHFEPASHDCRPYTEETESRNLKDDELSSVDKTPCYLCKRKCTSLEIIDCVECKSRFCFEHRLQEDHNCNQLINKKEELSRASKKPIVVREVPQVKVRGAKNDALKLKVALMKLKQKAKGLQSIPDAERVYFYVKNQVTNTVHEHFLCKKWSIGKCVSVLADELNIKNNNDKPGADKLVLKLNDEQSDYLPFECTVEEFILKDQCYNGQQLTICYQKH